MISCMRITHEDIYESFLLLFFERTARECAHFIDKKEERTSPKRGLKANLATIRPQGGTLLPQSRHLFNLSYY